jgi:hypothetical protein
VDIVDDSLSEDSLSEEDPSESSHTPEDQIAEKIFFDIPEQNKAKLVVQTRTKVGSFKSTN